MSPLLIAVALVLAVGLWGYLQTGANQSGPSASGSGRLSASQIAGYAANAGFAGDDLPTAVAIALAESGGDSQNQTGDGGTSWGLWQIHWTVHPEFDKSQLLDPQYNANAAYALYSRAGGAFTDWSAYNNGKFAGFLPAAQVASAPLRTDLAQYS